jgi:AcrR family transcriptional regulator
MTKSNGRDPRSVVATRHPNRRGEGGLLRGEILAAAAEILDATGNESAVTLRAVARQAGISAPSIYAHFPDRQAILLTLVEEAFSDLAEHLHAASEPLTDPTLRLRATCDAYLAYAAGKPQRYRLMFGGLWSAAEAIASSAVSTTAVSALGKNSLNLLTGQLQACVDAGTSTSTNAADDAVALWLGLHGLAHQRTVSTAFPWPPDIVERIVSRLAQLCLPAVTQRPVL